MSPFRVQDDDFRTPLVYAASVGHFRFIQLLLEYVPKVLLRLTKCRRLVWLQPLRYRFR